jgi:transcription antitermination factor NusA-like protein
VGEEEGGEIPDEVTVKMLVFKWQVGAVMGKRGSNINDIRKSSRANIRVTQPSTSGPVVPCAMDDDELITVRSN